MAYQGSLKYKGTHGFCLAFDSFVYTYNQILWDKRINPGGLLCEAPGGAGLQGGDTRENIKKI